MFPYADNLTGRYRAPVVWTLIIVMLVIEAVGYGLDIHRELIVGFGFTPLLFSVHPWSSAYALVTASFVHSDIFHVAGNCLFLWVFGRSLERLFGWKVFALLFPFLGIAGFLTQWIAEPASPVPVVGASGVIATLLGAYLALFPHARMRTVIMYLPFWKRITLPAWAFLGYWIGLQLFSLAWGSGQLDGVAYAVHVGGFALGVFGAAVWKTSYPMAEELLLEFVRTSFISCEPTPPRSTDRIEPTF
jgi:membrane associated rhomboid family serine protease